MNDYEKAKKLLEENGQVQVLLNYERMPEENQKKFLDQIVEIDFEQVNELYRSREEVKEKSNIEPISYIEKAKLSDQEVELYGNIGREELKRGKTAVVTMAGGQRNEIGAPRT
ncbi:MAG: hypothetical protein FWC79_00980 [Oscillospiraceae bacterium]|nr:hypothetical protein [Oscillospiraceae bacterium]